MWGKFFPKTGKWLTPIIKDKKLTYSNSSLKLWEEKKYTIELIPVKSYKKILLYLVANKVKYNRSFAKAGKGVFTTGNASIYSNASYYSGANKALKKLDSP